MCAREWHTNAWHILIWCAFLNLPAENHRISFDSRTHRGTISDDWLNANQPFLQLAQQLVHRSMLPMSRLWRCRNNGGRGVESKAKLKIQSALRYVGSCGAAAVSSYRQWTYRILIGCCIGRSQSVYSFTIVARISFKWYLYVLRTYVRRIFDRRSASMPYWTSSKLKAKYASARVTPINTSYLKRLVVAKMMMMAIQRG